MIELIKKNIFKSIVLLIVLIFDIFIISMALIDSKKEIIAPGGLNEVKSLIEVDGGKEIEGSFNTIYVYSYDHVSLLQKVIASFASYNDIFDSNPQIVLTDEEDLLAGEIQKNQSIEASLICAYNYAKELNPTLNIELDCTFTGYIVHTKQINHDLFEIGDIINYVKRGETKYDISNMEDLYIALATLQIGDEVNVIRKDGAHILKVNKELSQEALNLFGVYKKYYIKGESSSPSYQLHKANTLGPSGGLLQSLSIYSQITGIDLTKGLKVCGTGMIYEDGSIGKIGGISQKIITAIRSGADIFICPRDHEKDAKKAYYETKGHENMELIIVDNFLDAIVKLGGVNEN